MMRQELGILLRYMVSVWHPNNTRYMQTHALSEDML
jgi:hypothetical protein